MKTSLIPAILAPLGFSSCRENHVATNPPGEHKETTIIKKAHRNAEKTRKLRRNPVPMATSPRRKKRQIANKCLQPLLDGGSKADRVHIGGRRFYRRLTGFQITPGFWGGPVQFTPCRRSNVTIQDSLQRRVQSRKNVVESSRLPAIQSKIPHLPTPSRSAGRSRINFSNQKSKIKIRKSSIFKKTYSLATHAAGGPSHPLRTKQLGLHEHGLHGLLLQVGWIAVFIEDALHHHLDSCTRAFP